MELYDYAKALARRWAVVAVVALLSVAAAAVMALVSTPQFEATTQLFVSVQAGSQDASQLSQGSLFSSQRVKSYAEIASSPRVTEPVIEDLSLDMTADELSQRIEAEAPLDTVLINLTYTDPNAQRAALVANALGARFVTVVEKLERPDPGNASPVEVSLIREAIVPAAPVWPRPALIVGTAALLGVAVGVAIALLLDKLDTSFKDSDDLAETTRLPVLGIIGHDPDARMRPVLSTADPYSPRAEAFRQLRTNLQFLDVDGRPKTITVTSSVPEEGKSLTAANLALMLAQTNVSVCLVDADLRRPQIAHLLGLVGEVGLTSVLIGRVELSGVVQQMRAGLEVLTSGPIPPNPSELLSSEHMADVLKELAASYDTVIVDAPPLLPVTDATILAAETDGTLLVVRAGKTSRRQVARAVESLRSVDGRVLGALLNMAPRRGRDAEAYRYTYGYRPNRSHRLEDVHSRDARDGVRG